MRWYINDASLQGQFEDDSAFEEVLRDLMEARVKSPQLGASLYVGYQLSRRPVTPFGAMRDVVLRSRDRNLKITVMGWIDRFGPFLENDRLEEDDDYFEYAGLDVTDTGLGEAARRTRVGEDVNTFSFTGGKIDFARSPLAVLHGLADAPLGQFEIVNHWTARALTESAWKPKEAIKTWKMLVEAARERFPQLIIPDSVYQNPALARDSFDTVIRDHALELMGHLAAYMAARQVGGAESSHSREIIETFFTGERALFTGESESNRRKFANKLTFPDPECPGRSIFAHWHGKISRRYFRLHFEWPVPADATQLKIVYLGPKITRS